MDTKGPREPKNASGPNMDNITLKDNRKYNTSKKRNDPRTRKLCS